MRLAVIVYHKGLGRYPKAWIDQFVASVRNQTFRQFDIWELDYSDKEPAQWLFPEAHTHIIQPCQNHIQAMNELITDCFNSGYDYVLNTNIDDWYHPDRVKKQVYWMQKGYDLISSNFVFVDNNGRQFNKTKFERLNPAIEFRRGHNIICHPVVAYSKKFWLTCPRYDESRLGDEDFHLWKQTYGKCRFVIEPMHLCYYRVHQNQTGRIYAKRTADNTRI